MREKATRCVSPFLAWGDFHARSRFDRSTIPREKRPGDEVATIPEEKWGTTRSLSIYNVGHQATQPWQNVSVTVKERRQLHEKL